VASNGATTFDIKNQTTEDLPTLKVEGSTVWDDLCSKKWPKFLTKTILYQASRRKLTNGKNAKATWKKTYLRHRHRASLKLAKTCHTKTPGMIALK
jgi:hypothetical protein